MSRASRVTALCAAAVALAVLSACKIEPRDDYLGDKNPKAFGLGHAVDSQLLAIENVDVSPDGIGLPPGSGTAQAGAAVYASSCASCHGAKGEGKGAEYPQLLGGPSSAASTVDFSTDYRIPRTIGNYWPYATSLFDYIRRAMPLTAPRTLTADQVYAVTAYLLSQDGVIPANTVLDARTLPAVKMPALSRFVRDNRAGSMGGKTVR
jgi:cytochrome c